ncbi:MAG: MFS transporter [Chloroflexota bacterium]
MSRREIPAAALAVVAAVVLIALMDVGSRGFADFDSALIGYAVGTVFATAAVTYRYTLWITRPPTWRYFKAGWTNFLSWRNFRAYTGFIPIAWWRDIFGQTFILKRGVRRWVMHMCIFWGVVLSCMITFPLTFGWIHFTMASLGHYWAWFFGFPVLNFYLDTALSFVIFHALDFSAVILLFGLAIAFGRRVSDLGLLTTQRFGFDLVPLVLLLAIAVTGLALSASSDFWSGKYYSFIALTHEVVVVGWLISIPFGKFFHIVERPASIGVTLYQTVNQDIERTGERPGIGRCRRCGVELPSRQFIDDLKATLVELRQTYDLGDDRGSLQDYCPTCKRVLRGEAYYHLMGKRFL